MTLALTLLRTVMLAVSMILMLHDTTKAYYISTNPYYKKPYVRTVSQIFKRLPQNIGSRPNDPGFIIHPASHNNTLTVGGYQFGSTRVNHATRMFPNQKAVKKVWVEDYQRSPRVIAEPPMSVYPSAHVSQSQGSLTQTDVLLNVNLLEMDDNLLEDVIPSEMETA